MVFRGRAAAQGRAWCDRRDRQRRPGLRVAALALLFLGVQVFVSFHAAAYGPGEHDHGGGACEIQIVAKNLGGIVSAPVAVPLPVPAPLSGSRPWHDDAGPCLAVRRTCIRAPPGLPA